VTFFAISYGSDVISRADIGRNRRFLKRVGHFKRKFQVGDIAHQPLLVSEN